MPYDFILDKLPYAPEEIFVDAASSWGIGGFYGDNYFMIPIRDLARFHKIFDECRDKHQMDISPKILSIAYLELLAALISIVCFSALCRGRIVRLNCDNTNAVSWLKKSRCSAGIGFRMLSVIELYKHKFQVKVSTHHIPGEANISADSLSRGTIPSWLQKYGKKCLIDLDNVADLLMNPLPSWKEVMSR